MTDVFADASTISASDAEVQSISTLADKAIELQAEIDSLGEVLAERSRELRVILDAQLPVAMDEAGCEEFKASNGAKIKLQQFVNAAIQGEHQEEAFDWLRDNGHGDLIKRELKLALARGQDNVAPEIIAVLKAQFGMVPDDKTGVHPQTLMAFCKEQLADGKELPASLFNVYVGRRAKITPRKD